MELISMEELLALLREICGEESIAADTELMESGLLDSYAFINLLSELDMRAISIEPTRVGTENFTSAERIYLLCHK
ncbi:phosphopantetheine-binding protein [Huintestinicola sp.]|uniref:phosphopantetheine-binding protein n=1 Tax=Huintestinicola sp. TaxID=2981661 RepID=UPI003D7C3F2B